MSLITLYIKEKYERRQKTKDPLYGELKFAGKRNLRRPQLRYRDLCKRDMKELSINKNKWEELATDNSKWISYLQATLKTGEKKSLS